MRIHQREQKVGLTQSEIGLAVEDILDGADLTEWETVKVLTGAFHDLIAHRAKMGVRMERHGTYDKKVGWRERRPTPDTARTRAPCSPWASPSSGTATPHSVTRQSPVRARSRCSERRGATPGPPRGSVPLDPHRKP